MSNLTSVICVLQVTKRNRDKSVSQPLNNEPQSGKGNPPQPPIYRPTTRPSIEVIRPSEKTTDLDIDVEKGQGQDIELQPLERGEGEVKVAEVKIEAEKTSEEGEEEEEVFTEADLDIDLSESLKA